MAIPTRAWFLGWYNRHARKVALREALRGSNPTLRGYMLNRAVRNQAGRIHDPEGRTPLPRQELVAHVVEFVGDHDRAASLAHDLRDHSSVWLGPDNQKSQATSMPQFVRVLRDARPLECHILHGVPGSGKTRLASDIISRFSPGTVAWWSPSALNANEAATSRVLGPNATSRCYLFGPEIFRKTDFETLVIDDYGKLYAGTLDLLSFIMPNLQRLVLTGDPAQGGEPFPVATALSRSLHSDISRITTLFPETPYATLSWRQGPSMCAQLGWYSHLQENHGAFVAVTTPPPGLPLVATSARFVNSISNGGVDAITLTDSQGATFEGDYVLDLTGLTNRISDKLALVGLTRGKRNVFLLVPEVMNLGENELWGSSFILSSLVAMMGKAETAISSHIPAGGPRARSCKPLLAYATRKHLRRCVPALTVEGAPGLAGAASHAPPTTDTGILDEELHRRLQTWYPVLRHVQRDRGDAPRLDAPEPVPVDLSRRVMDPEHRIDLDVDAGRENREQHVGEAVTVQTGVAVNPHVLSHRAGDPATEELSMRKRLRYQSAVDNEEEYARGAARGALLYKNYCRATGHRALPYSEALMEQCAEEALDSWLDGRTVDQALSSLDKEDFEEPVEYTRNFLKTQLLRKDEKYSAPAGAGQTISDMSFSRNMKHAAAALYVERQVLATMPQNIYVHLRRNHGEFRRWCGAATMASRNREFAACDYSSWDASVDGACLQFDRALLESLGLPQPLVDEFVALRINTRNFAGNLGLMQFSGDRWTFLLNTLRNIAYTNTRCALPAGRTWQAYAGDDLLLFRGTIPIHKAWDQDEWLFRAKDVEHLRVGEFIGMRVTNRAEVFVSTHKLRTQVSTVVTRRVKHGNLTRSEMAEEKRRAGVKLVAINDLIQLGRAGEFDAGFPHLRGELAVATHLLGGPKAHQAYHNTFGISVTEGLRYAGPEPQWPQIDAIKRVLYDTTR
uniref:RNA-dependent RNA polymerase n=1 Tax=Rhizoctonia solani flexi-like virus 1 TaxID=2600111 RepID=A0A5B8GQ53_9VIRU|nr:RNA-dependent RNA polymerase [Rhizoctonia solani flexi-like virus 1]